MLSCLFIAAFVVTCWEGLASLALLDIMFSCAFFTFQCGVLVQVWYLFVSIPDLCPLLCQVIVTYGDRERRLHICNKYQNHICWSLYFQTTNPKIAPVTVNNCKTSRNPVTHHKEETCTQYTERFTYAVPLEIIYLTPLWNWNPYHLEYVGKLFGVC